MMRRVCLYLVGSFVLVSLAGCGRGLFQTAEREPWRRDAEVACLKSGAVHETVNLVRMDPISGPGVCGAEFPLKVATLENGGVLGFADDLRPSGGVAGASQPRWPVSSPSQQPTSLIPPSINSLRGSEPDYVGRAAPYRDESAQRGRSSDYSSSVYSPPASFTERALLPRLGPAQGSPNATLEPVSVQPAATLACPIVSALDKWIADSVQPAAVRWFGVPVVEIKQISAYSCRGMNGNPNAHISEHAFGNALDVAAFTLSDGRRISVKDGWHGLAEEQGFLHDVQGGACQQFSTVLAPGSNVYHYDHIHVDLMRRSSGRVICQPAAVPGEQIAARASQRHAASEPRVTGSISQGLSRLFARKPTPKDDDDLAED